MFFNLTDFNSFGKLPIEDKTFFEKELSNLYKKSKLEKWYIEKEELNIHKKPFAYGGFSEIYDCDWRGLKIAVKKPKQKKILTILNVMKEIEVWNTVRHPNIVQFLGISNSDNKILILLEKINGCNLKEYIERRNFFKNKKKIINELVKVFYFLHCANPPIIYRDLKPDNILIDTYGNLKLTDLGLSKFIENDQNEEFQMTECTGTPRWMAPEVFRGEKYNISSDIYSLGMIIYYITSEKIPFKNFTLDEFDDYMSRNEEHVFKAPSRYRYIVDKCIQNNAILRPDIKSIYYNISQ
jgi:serine/threonine protein kinase